MTTSTPKLRIRTFSVGHAPQVGNRLLYPGRITEPLTTPPTRAKDFRAGDVLAYLVELDAGTKTYRVVFLSSTPTRHRELARELEASSPVDVLILPVASWEKVDGYPRTLIQALRPRYILLSHFNDFFGPRSPRRTLVLVDLDGMLREVQRVVSAEDDPEFEQIMVPDIKATLTLR
jgi:hypothetical protein